MASLAEIVLPGFTRVDRYVLRQLLVALVVTTGGLALLIWLTQSLHFITLVVDRGMSLFGFLWLTGLMVPSFVAVILPITTYMVIQFIYGRMDGDRELTVLRAAGLSPWALARPALVLAGLSVVACYLLNLWILPASYGAFREREFEVRNRLAAFLLQDGVFTQVTPDLTVYVRRRDADGTLHGIMVDDARDKHSRATILAESGHMVVRGNVPRVLLEDGSREELDAKSGRLEILSFHRNTLDLAPKGTNGAERYHDVSEMTVPELLHPTGAFLSRDVPKMKAEAHKRLSGPLTAGSFALVALVAVLTGPFRRYGGIVRPLLSVASVMGLLAAQLAVGNVAARNLTMLPLVWLEAIVPSLVCLWLLLGEGVMHRWRAGGAVAA